VRLGKSAAIFSITTAPGGTSTSVRPRTTAATTAQVTHWVGIAGIKSGRSLNGSSTGCRLIGRLSAARPVHHRGVDHARHHERQTDTGAVEFDAQGLGQADDGNLVAP